MLQMQIEPFFHQDSDGFNSVFLSGRLQWASLCTELRTSECFTGKVLGGIPSLTLKLKTLFQIQEGTL